MPVLARDAVASDHLVFAWPFPIGPEEHEVSCADDELVVMCPSFMVGDRLGPGRHRWRTPDPMRPVSAYFVLTAPVEVSFDMLTQFVIPMTGQPVRVRAAGSLQVRCMDPALLIAQFVGLPFDAVNDGVLRSVSRSIERMLARLLTRRVVMANTPNAITDPQMLPSIVEELVAYNPAAGAVFGVELVRMGHITIMADDGSRPWQQMQPPSAAGSNPRLPANGDTLRRQPEPANLLETVRQVPPPAKAHAPTMPPPIPAAAQKQPPRVQNQPQVEASGEIVVKPKNPPATDRTEKTTAPGHAAAAPAPTTQQDSVPDPLRVIQTPVPSRRAGAIEVPQSQEETTQPGVDIVRGPLPGAPSAAVSAAAAKDSKPTPPEPRGAILGIGMAPIGSGNVASGSVVSGSVGSGSGAVSGEIMKKIPPGARVLVPGPNGLMQSATVRQLLQGYYELEVGGSGETIWVPMAGVVPE